MEAKLNIGIYITANSATVSAVSLAGKDSRVVDCFTVNPDTRDNLFDNPESANRLAELIAQGCAQRAIALQDSNIAAAVDSSMFMQHNVHSEFSDAKQISQTVRFDTEEAVATDIGDLAIAFQISSPAQAGSNLSVFTAQRKLLGGILSALNKNNIDPVYIEPDIICLSRFISHNFGQNPSQAGSAGSPQVSLFAILSSSNGYLIVPPVTGRQSKVFRTFLVGSAQDRFALLKNQITVTTAMLSPDENLDSLAVFDSAGLVEAGRLFETVGIKSESIDLTARMIGESAPILADKVSLAIAAGAALAFDDKNRVDFRADFSPYKGKQVRFEKNLKIVSVCAVICLLALGVLAQINLYKVNKPRKLERESFNNDYRLVLPGRPVPRTAIEATKDLEGELRRLQKLKQGLEGNGDRSVPDKFALLLRAFNACAEPANLDIQSVDITPRTIRITGSTANSAGTGKLRDAILQNNLKIDQEDLLYKGNRHNFNMTLSVK